MNQLTNQSELYHIKLASYATGIILRVRKVGIVRVKLDFTCYQSMGNEGNVLSQSVRVLKDTEVYKIVLELFSMEM